MKLVRLLPFTLLLFLLAACVDPPPAQNLAPKAVISVTPDEGALAGTLIELDGSGSTDPDGTVDGFSWTIDGVAHSDDKVAEWRPDEPGYYTIELTVTDNRGLSDSKEVVYQVLPIDPNDNEGPEPSPEGTVRFVLNEDERSRGIVLNYGDEYRLEIEVSESWMLTSSEAWLSFEQDRGDAPEGSVAKHTVSLRFHADKLPPEQDHFLSTINLLGLDTDASAVPVPLVLNVPTLEAPEEPLALRKAVKRSEAAAFEIRNAGHVAPLTLKLSSDAPDWLTLDAPDLVVSPNSTRVVTVHATCSDIAGAREALITIISNDPRAEVSTIPVRVECVTPPPSDFHIELLHVGDEPFTYLEWEAAKSAAARWSEVILVGLETVVLDEPQQPCGTDYPALLGTIENIVIYVGKGATGGVAGTGSHCPLALREAGPDKGLPYAGVVTILPTAWEGPNDLLALENLFVHEFAHALGFGTLWEERDDLVKDGTYIGLEASKQYGDLLGAGPTSPPLETHGGIGTAGSHWAAEAFGDAGNTLAPELMTGSVSPLSRLSKLTIGAMADLGYQIDPNYTLADAYTLPTDDEVAPSSMRMLNLSGDAFR